MGTILKKFHVLAQLLGVVLAMVPADAGAELVTIVIAKLKELADELIDKVEDLIEDSETKIDDKYGTPVINVVRREFNIPDNDEE